MRKRKGAKFFPFPVSIANKQIEVETYFLYTVSVHLTMGNTIIEYHLKHIFIDEWDVRRERIFY